MVGKKLAIVVVCIVTVLIILTFLLGYDKAKMLFQEGQELQQKGEYEDAIAKYNLILTDFADGDYAPKARNATHECLYEWGSNLVRNKKYSEAIEKYNTILEDYPVAIYSFVIEAKGRCLYKWGLELEQNKQYEDAIAKYNSVKRNANYWSPSWHDIEGGTIWNKADERIPTSYYDWGLQLQQNRKYEDAIAKYDVIIDEYEDRSSDAKERKLECLYEWGLQYQQIGLCGSDFFDSPQECEKAIEKYEMILTANYYLGTLKDKLFKSLESLSPEYLYELGTRLQKDKEYDYAIETYQIIVDKYPESESNAEKAIILIEVAKIADYEPEILPYKSYFEWDWSWDIFDTDVKYKIENDAGEKLYVFFVGPDINCMTVEAGDTKTIKLAPGTYEVAARTDRPSVTPFYDEEQILKSGYRYSWRFFINATTYTIT